MNNEPSYMRSESSLSPQERPTSGLVSDLWNHTELLLHQELDLVRADLERKAVHLKKDLTEATVSGAVLYAGMLVLLAGAVSLLAKWMDVWGAALLVGALVLGVGYFLLRKRTHDLQKTDLAPREPGRSITRTTQSITEAIK